MSGENTVPYIGTDLGSCETSMPKLLGVIAVVLVFIGVIVALLCCRCCCKKEDAGQAAVAVLQAPAPTAPTPVIQQMVVGQPMAPVIGNPVAPMQQAAVVAEPVPGCVPLPASGESDVLQAQLVPLTVRELRERALADGCHANDIENARDGDDPKSELIVLILRQAAKVPPGIDLNALRTQLMGMDVRALRNRAAVDGISNDMIEDARDGDDPKAALIDLIVAQARPKQGP
jgi:hypothetical protein|eukprot:COSAG06_NODE_7325_length_2546_cov_1.997548_4_plen_231_part_00